MYRKAWKPIMSLSTKRVQQFDSRQFKSNFRVSVLTNVSNYFAWIKFILARFVFYLVVGNLCIYLLFWGTLVCYCKYAFKARILFLSFPDTCSKNQFFHKWKGQQTHIYLNSCQNCLVMAEAQNICDLRIKQGMDDRENL